MKYLVCISKVPDTTTKISFTDNNTKFNESGVQFIVNPYDEWYALVRALELKETIGGNVTILTVGRADVEPIIRKALAIGADEAVRIDANSNDSANVANQIAQYAKANSFDIILLGKETIDYNGSVVGGLVAAQLDLPFISLASKLNLNGNTATIEREAVGGTEVVEVDTPFVLSAAKGMAEQRIPNMRGIMAARTKPLQVLQAFTEVNYTQLELYELPKEKGAVKLISPENVEELVNLLHNEAKVI